MYHEQQTTCMQCREAFRVALDCPEYPPKAERIYEFTCPCCGKVSNTMPTAGTQCHQAPEGLPVARVVMN